jgi:hypothetical protein
MGCPAAQSDIQHFRGITRHDDGVEELRFRSMSQGVSEQLLPGNHSPVFARNTL